jgi:hypothetical protein
MEESRRTILRRKVRTAKDYFIGSLLPPNTTISGDVSVAEMGEARDKYDSLAKQGKLPIFCRVFDNIFDKSREVLRASESSDLVYSFLVDLKEDVSEIASQQYGRSEAYKKSNEGKQDFGEYLSSKVGFLDAMIDSFRFRGENFQITDWSDSAVVNSDLRYNYLLSLANLNGEEKTKAVEELVSDFPSYPWENFYWPEEKREE